MKKLTSLILTVCMLMALFASLSVLPAFAASNTYDLDELELQVTIPADYSVITRDTPASDPIFSDWGTTKSEMLSLFESSSIYLNAITDIYNEEIVVTMVENSYSDFSLFSDTELNALASLFANQYADYGLDVSKYEIYQHSQAKFIKIYFTDTVKSVYGLQYSTVYEGKTVNFTMRSYEGSLSFRQETAIKTIVDSIEFDKAPPVADQVEKTDSFTYTDTKSGVSFTVPANWKQEAFTEDREHIDVKFGSTEDNGCAMIYASTDMWEQVPAYDKVGYTRSDVDNSFFPKSNVAEMFSTTADKISTVTYNGVEYFKSETDYTSDTYGFDVTVTMTQLVYFENGWMYMFQFGGASTHKLYSDFESLLRSVKYPTVSNAEEIGSSSNTTSNNSSNNTTSNNSKNNSEDSPGVIASVGLLAIVVVIVVVYMNYKKANRTPIHNTPTPEPLSQAEPSNVCSNCGQALPLDSAFCHICGTPINKGE